MARKTAAKERDKSIVVASKKFINLNGSDLKPISSFYTLCDKNSSIYTGIPTGVP
jgi:peptidyl-tRNA hydrolase